MIFSLDAKKVLVTGGTGTWGQEFVRQIVGRFRVREVTVFSRGEARQVDMRRAFQHAGEIRYLLGDVRDRERLRSAARGVDVIVHLAALKHISVVEEQPHEALQTNTLGSQNVIDAAAESGVEAVLYVSSDKAVDPLNFYGITKLAAERLMVAANLERPGTRFVVYRAGNVMGSNGSVVPVFQEQLLRHNTITLTDPGMTRFFLSKSQVVDLALQALGMALGGEVFIPKMKAASVDLLSRIMIKHLGGSSTEVRVIGMRPAEKHSELLISGQEAGRTHDLERLWVVLPFFPTKELASRYACIPRVAFAEYGSREAPKFSWEELERLLAEEGFLSRSLEYSQASLHFRKDHWEFH